MTDSELQALTMFSWIIQAALAIAVIVYVRKSFRAKPQLIVMAIVGLIFALIPCGPIMIFLLIGWAIPLVLVHVRYQRQVTNGVKLLDGAGSFPTTAQRPSPSSNATSAAPRSDDSPRNPGTPSGDVLDDTSSKKPANRDNPFL